MGGRKKENAVDRETNTQMLLLLVSVLFHPSARYTSTLLYNVNQAAASVFLGES